MGRPKAKIDWAEVDRMLSAGCTGTEVAASLGIAPDTLYRACEAENKIGFADYSAEKKQFGHKLLKMARLENALNGNTAMQIWLSKQWLGEKDQSAVEMSGKVELPAWLTGKKE